MTGLKIQWRALGLLFMTLKYVRVYSTGEVHGKHIPYLSADASDTEAKHIFTTLYFRLSHRAGSPLNAALDYASKHHSVYEKDLLHLVSIPSISSLHEHLPDVRKAAEWLKTRLKSAGMQVQFNTGGFRFL